MEKPKYNQYEWSHVILLDTINVLYLRSQITEIKRRIWMRCSSIHQKNMWFCVELFNLFRTIFLNSFPQPACRNGLLPFNLCSNYWVLGRIWNSVTPSMVNFTASAVRLFINEDKFNPSKNYLLSINLQYNLRPVPKYYGKGIKYY